jgi:hypothetical protein
MPQAIDPSYLEPVPLSVGELRGLIDSYLNHSRDAIGAYAEGSDMYPSLRDLLFLLSANMERCLELNKEMERRAPRMI